MSSRRHNVRENSKEDGWEVWGGYMNAKKQKLQRQFCDDTPGQLIKDGSGSNIFSGISIHVNGYTKPSSDELKRLMMLHGGNYEHYLYRTRVTHVIATNLPNSKVLELKGLKVVKPEWITDSIAEGKLLSYTNYLLYTARSGLQKGLHTFITSRDNSVQSEESFISKQSNRNSDSFENGLNSTNSKISSENGECSGKNQITDSKKLRVISPGKTVDARDPKFLNEFYNNSRLHYLSTWKAEWKNYVNELQVKGSNFTGREELRKIVQEEGVNIDNISNKTIRKPRRYVMHIDMDCFFVSVGLRKRPELKGKPVAVTHSKGNSQRPDPLTDTELERCLWEKKKSQGRRGKMAVRPVDKSNAEDDMKFPDESDTDEEDIDITVTMTTTEPFHSMAEIASCSYEARQTGVKNGMFMGRARSLCPELVTIPYDFDGYKEVSKTLYNTVASFTHDIEAVSCDEMLVDCTDLLSDTGATPLQFATLLRSKIFKQTKCPSSAGIGSNILLARMATRKAKPNGQFFLTEDLISDYIKSQSVKDLPGVGYSTAKRLEVMKVGTCDDLQRVSLDTLQKEFGPKTGQSLYRFCRGQDDRPIKMEQQRKSVSADVNYGIRFDTDCEAAKFIEELSEEVSNRLKNIGMKGKTITLKLMVRREDAPKHTSKFMGHGICNNFSKSTTLPMATDDSRIIAKETIFLLRSHKVEAADLRGIGIQVHKLELAKVCCPGDMRKMPSILNYAVKQSHTSISPDTRNKKQLFEPESVGNEVRGIDESVHEEIKSRQGKIGEVTDHVNRYSDSENKNTSSSYMFENKTDNVPDIINVAQTDTESDIIVPSHTDLLQDLVSRQIPDEYLPPLPRLPDIRTPDCGRRASKCQTPEIETHLQADVDYFPSPSQIDPDVLCELPLEIREQIEREVKQRRKEPTHTNIVASTSSGAGSSHWQQKHEKNTNCLHSEADRHSRDTIVDLPSPSQIDLSCLEALPEYLQAELRQAYAKQDSKLRDNTRQLTQAKSPAKSPKRSPGKGSPKFKIPSGKPSGRGRKKGSSKKTLFKDQVRTGQQNSSARQHTVQESLNSTIKTTTTSDNLVDISSGSSLVHCKSDKELVHLDDTENIDDISEYTTDTVCSVSLCGAVLLQDVRQLLREWITSTPAPQADDEEILKNYMIELVTDKNLEQVDLLLKYMLRNIKQLKDTDWLHSLKRIFIHTQAAVYDLYGSELTSIKL